MQQNTCVSSARSSWVVSRATAVRLGCVVVWGSGVVIFPSWVGCTFFTRSSKLRAVLCILRTLFGQVFRHVYAQVENP